MLTAVVLAASMVVGQAEEESPGQKMVKKFAEDFTGHWVRESTTDETDTAKKLDATIQWAFENTSLSLQYRVEEKDGDVFQAKGLIGWDGRKRVLRSFGVGDGGLTIGERMYELQDGKWAERFTAVFADGKTFARRGTLTTANNGNTHIWKYTNRVDTDGKRLPDTTATWKRVKK